MHGFFVLNANAQSHSLNMHRQLPSGDRYPNFDMSLYLHHFYVCESSEGYKEINACVNASKTSFRKY